MSTTSVKRVCFYCLALFIIASSPGIAADDKPEKLHVGIGLRPVYQYATSEKQYAGLDVELGMAIAREAGYELELVDYPWPRIIYLMKSGKVDLTFSAAKTPQRMAWARFSNEHFRHGRNYLYVLKSREYLVENINRLRELEKYPLVVGVQRGYKYSPEFEALLETGWFINRLQVFNEAEIVIESLIKGRVDVFIGSEYGTADILQRLDVKDEVSPVFTLEPYYQDAKTFMMFSKASVSENVVKDFDAAIRRLRAAGKLLEITQKYRGQG